MQSNSKNQAVWIKKSSVLIFTTALLVISKGESTCSDPANEWTGTTGNQRWNNAGNWSMCIPGTTITAQDYANFGQIGSGVISLDASGGDLAISPGLNVLSFNNLSGFTLNSSGTTNHIQFNLAGSTLPSLQVLAGSQLINSVMTINSTTLNIATSDSSQLTLHNNLNDISPGFVIFTGPGEIIIDPTAANSGISIGGSFTQISGSVELTNTHSVSSLTGSKMNPAQGFIIGGGNYISRNSATITGSATGASNDCTGSSGKLVLSSGAISIENTGMINGSSARGSSFNIGPVGITINGGAVDAMNTGSVNTSGSNIGCQFFTSGPITVNGGSITSTNAAAINSTLPSRGCNFQAATDFTINAGSITQTNTNDGTINGTNALGCSITTSTNTILNNGTVISTNNGTITAGTGVRLFGNTNLTINNGSVLSTNNGTINGTSAFGSVLTTNNNLNINGGVVTSLNTGIVNAGIGSQIRGVANLVINGGILMLNNSGIIDSGSGIIGTQATAPNIHITGGMIYLSNSGTVATPASNSSGIQILATTNLTMSGGTLTIAANTGNVIGTNNSGSRIEAPGGFTFSAGVLVNDDTVQTPTLTIGTAGNMAGKGIFSDINNAATTQITNAGTVTPGNLGIGATNPGVMSIHGSYTQTSLGNLIINILNEAAFSQLSVLGSTTGTANLDGQLEIGLSPNASFVPGDIFSIVITEQPTGLTGIFSNIINGASESGLIAQIQYFPDRVDLFFTPTATDFIGGFSKTLLSSINQINMSLARQMMRLHHRLATEFNKTNEISQEDPWFQPELLASNDLSVALNDYKQCNPWNLYFGLTGNTGKVFTLGDQLGFNYWSSGVAAGFDYSFSQIGLGIRFDYDHIEGQSKSWGRFLVNQTHACLYTTYASTRCPEFAFNGIVGGSYEQYQFHRNVNMLSNPALGTPQGGEFDALLGMEYTLPIRPITIIPFVNLQYIYLGVEKYKEYHAGTFSLQMKSQTNQSLRSMLGARFNYIWGKNKGYSHPIVITTELDVAWQREYLDNERSVQFAPSAFAEPFSTLIIPSSGHNILLIGIDLLATYHEKYDWEASYDFEWSRDFLNHNFYLGFIVNF